MDSRSNENRLIAVRSPNQALPLVLLPGAMATWVAWRYQIASFAPSRTVMVPEQHYRLTTIQAMAHNIAPRLPAAFDLVAWSMGGYIAFELYPLVRERIRRMILVCTTARPESPESRQRREDLLRTVESEGIRTVYERLLDSNLLDSAALDPEFRKEALTATEKLGEQTLRSQTHAMITRRDSREALRQMQAHTLIVAARHDIVTPPACSIEMASLLPRGTLQIVELAGHVAPWERSEEVNQLMHRFLDE